VGTATVSDAPVILTAGGFTATANTAFTGQVATFTDAAPDAASQYVVKITWGDGSTSPGTVTAGANTTSFNVDGTHTYTSSGSMTYSVSVTNLAGTIGQASGIATVADPVPVVTAPTIAPAVGLPFTGVVATFTDANPALTNASFAATINWGDNSPTSAGTIAALPGGGFSVTGTHTYNTVGNFIDTITVFRLPDNKSTGATGTAVVNNPVLSATGQSIKPATGLPFTGVVATFTDNNPSGQPSDYTVVVDWGDGTSSSTGHGVTVTFVPAPPASGVAFTVTGTHTYLIPNKTYP